MDRFLCEVEIWVGSCIDPSEKEEILAKSASITKLKEVEDLFSPDSLDKINMMAIRNDSFGIIDSWHENKEILFKKSNLESLLQKEEEKENSKPLAIGCSMLLANCRPTKLIENALV